MVNFTLIRYVNCKRKNLKMFVIFTIIGIVHFIYINYFLRKLRGNEKESKIKKASNLLHKNLLQTANGFVFEPTTIWKRAPYFWTNGLFGDLTIFVTVLIFKIKRYDLSTNLFPNLSDTPRIWVTKKRS